jgi:hypothetical protein
MSNRIQNKTYTAIKLSNDSLFITSGGVTKAFKAVP